jgi:hypothetical protein
LTEVGRLKSTRRAAIALVQGDVVLGASWCDGLGCLRTEERQGDSIAR